MSLGQQIRHATWLIFLISTIYCWTYWAHSNYTLIPQTQHKVLKEETFTTERAPLPKEQPYQIVFMRTSSEPFELFELCAFYSAARSNPDAMVVVLEAETHTLPSQHFGDIHNIRIEQLDLASVFAASPLEQWYRSRRWNVTAFVQRVRFLSDAARLAYLWKQGGIYMDTDFITLKSLHSLSNTVLYQNDGGQLANGLLVFDKGHDFLHYEMTEFAKQFSPKKQDIVMGPILHTQVWKSYNKKLQIAGSDTIPALPRKTFLPYGYGEAQRLLGPFQTEVWKDSYAVHLWRNKMRSRLHNNHVVAKRGSAMAKIATEHCPSIANTWIQ